MDKSYYAFVEPYGQDNPASKIERCWNSFAGSYGLRTNRITQFDPYAAMSRSPIEYRLLPFEIGNQFPDDDWIVEAFTSFVHDEIVETDDTVPQRFFPEKVSDIKVSDEYLMNFLWNSEWQNIVQVELPKDNSEMEMARSIYKLLCNQAIGSSKNKKNNNFEAFAKHVLPLIAEKKRLMFVLPGFPFKDQNRFRVPFDAGCVDFSEISFLIRLHNLIQTLYQVHPFGGEALVLSDGRLYKDIFGISDEEVEEYQWRLKYYRNKLNLQGDVSIIDLKELIERADVDGIITKLVACISESIKRHLVGTPSFEALVQGMKWNMNSRALLSDLSDEVTWQVIKKGKEEVESTYIDRWEKYDEQARTAAIKYASVNLMLRWTQLIEKFFPESIRCTVHPKPNQFALTVNYAWNGVAWSDRWPKSLENIKTVPYYSLGNQSEIYLVRLHSTNYPCFFTKEKNNRVLECAKNVLKKDGWNIDSIFGREFTVYDSEELSKLGENDPYFAWERECKSKEYYTALLQFRISHYKKYGFGVHAIFWNNILIGQMGLQVLDENANQIEFVIFLGKEYVSQGIGTKLLDYLFRRCKEEEIDEVFAVIRKDNKQGSAIASKYNAEAIKTMTHYHQTGILYRFKLK